MSEYTTVLGYVAIGLILSVWVITYGDRDSKAAGEHPMENFMPALAVLVLGVPLWPLWTLVVGAVYVARWINR